MSPSETLRAVAESSAQAPLTRVRAALALKDPDTTSRVMRVIAPLGADWRRVCRNYLIGLDPLRITPCVLANAFDRAWSAHVGRETRASTAAAEVLLKTAAENKTRFRARKRP